MLRKSLKPKKLSLANCLLVFSLLLAIAGSLTLIPAFINIFRDDQDKHLSNTSAMSAIHVLGLNYIRQIERTVAPAIQRSRKIAANPETAHAILSGDQVSLTELCNREVCNSTEIDTVALFDAQGKILAINVVYADGSAISKARVNQVMGKSFAQRPVISRCLSNASDQEALEFQTHCDITPAFFDSIGLAVAHTVPIFDPSTQDKIGAISTRLRFERISSLVERNVGPSLGNIFLVTDNGEYFSESINSGKMAPPIEPTILKSFVAPMVAEKCLNSHIVLKDSVLELFRLSNFTTLGGGGIQIMVIGNLQQIERETRLARLVTFGTPLCVGLLLLLCAGIAWNNATLSTQHKRLIASEGSKRRLATIIECSEDAIIIEQIDGKIGYWNAGAQWLFGYTPEEVLDKVIISFVPEEFRADKDRLLRMLLNGERIEHYETVRIAKDGSHIPVSITASAVRDDTGKITGIAKIVRDIRAHKHSEQELDMARRMAEAANQSKSEFLANMSHEIRTPMTAILGFADLLDNGVDLCSEASFAQNAVQTIRSNANHLLTVINDILDMSKIDAGKLDVECVSFSLLKVLEEVVSLMQSQADGKGIALNLVYETKIPSHIKSDSTRLRQVLLNLVGNAVKFTEIGDVTLKVAYIIETNLVQFRIVDTGIGMTKAQLAVTAKFGSFSQADTSTTRRFGGSGLGLRISNSLVTKLGGNLSVESEIGNGSTFTATINAGDLEEIEFLESSIRPLTQKDWPITHNSIDQVLENRPLAGLQILLVEDGPDNQRLISFVFKKAGAEVTIAENGLIAAEIIESNTRHFDVVFMDMQMPVLDGYDATKRLRLGGYKLPIIALTAHAMQSDRDKCLGVGCDDFATKPIDRPALIRLAIEYGRKCTPFVLSESLARQSIDSGPALV